MEIDFLKLDSNNRFNVGHRFEDVSEYQISGCLVSVGMYVSHLVSPLFRIHSSKKEKA